MIVVNNKVYHDSDLRKMSQDDLLWLEHDLNIEIQQLQIHHSLSLKIWNKLEMKIKNINTVRYFIRKKSNNFYKKNQSRKTKVVFDCMQNRNVRIYA